MTQEKTREITLATARVIDGDQRQADETVTVPDLEARNLVRAGLARFPSDAPAGPPAPAIDTPIERETADAVPPAPAAEQAAVEAPAEEPTTPRPARARSSKPAATAAAPQTETEA